MVSIHDIYSYLYQIRYVFIENVWNLYSIHYVLKPGTKKWMPIRFYYMCDFGVKQGEVLSPFLFSLFINDREDYLRY